jgi:murein L,D-transpeptidase YafK
LGPKRQLGDGQASEGFYYVRPIQLNPLSTFHLSFNLGYPNRYDRIHGRTGSALMVHGSCVSIGCYAMTDSVIEEIYTLADAAFNNGQPFFRVHLFPFRMTKGNMERHQDSAWIEFWRNLREGYDYFENTFKPPNVLVRNRRYVFEPSN